MSYRHIKLNKIRFNDKIVEYRILCPDFNEESQLEDFGTIELNLDDKSFKHNNNQLWIMNKIYPIDLFKLTPKEREKRIEKEYSEYGSGIWAMSIFNFIQNCLQNDNFPDEKDLIG